MERIKINEIDNTVSASNTDDTEVVYVPGFAWTGLDGQSEIKSKHRVPILCTTLSEFENYFGTTAPRFKTNQMYPVYVQSGNVNGFISSALPNTYDTIPWFAGETEVVDDDGNSTFTLGDIDPSYTYAKELIAKGIPVIYERLNKSTTYPTNIYEWKPGKAYEINDKVVAFVDGGEHYFICKGAHTSGESFDGSKWVVYKGFPVYNDIDKTSYKVGDVLYIPNDDIYKVVKSNTLSVTHTFAEGDYDKNHEGGYKRGDVVRISTGSGSNKRTVKAVCRMDVESGVDFSKDNFAFNTSSTLNVDEWSGEATYEVNDVIRRTIKAEDLTTDNFPVYSNSKAYLFGDFVQYSNEFYVCSVDVTTPGEFNEDNFDVVTADAFSITFRNINSSTGEATDPLVDFGSSVSSPTHWICNFFDIEVRNSESTSFINGSKYYWVSDPSQGENNNSYFICNIDNAVEFSALSTQPSEVPIYDVTVDTFYKNVGGTIEDGLTEGECVFDSANGTLLDASRFGVKYFTTGGYPNFEFVYGKSNTNLASKIARFAAVRGDAIAMIDHTDKPERPLVGVTSVYNSASNMPYGIPSEFASFATMITPWATYRATSTLSSEGLLMPGSFGYFDALANTKRYYTTWLPVAGAVRGVVSNLVAPHTDKILTNTIADGFQVDPSRTGVSINAITYINNYGYCVWGNRTLMNLTADSKGFAALFLNLRNVMSDIKKRAFATAQRYMFEQVDVQLWIKFKYMMSSLLDEMKDYGVVADYQFIQNVVTDKTKLSCTIKVWPVYSVESFEIGIVLTDEDVNVE